MRDDEMVEGGVELKDRSAGLIALGIVQLVLGGICALMVPFMLLGTIAAAVLEDGASGSTSPAMMVPGLLCYGATAVCFIWLGIGSIKARRWARALLLVGSWFWLISGSFGLIAMAFLFPDMCSQMSADGELPEAVGRIMMYVTMGFMAVFYVMLPGMFVLFYGSRHTKATCERKDATARWTDRCPLPVLAVCIAAAACAVWAPLMGFYGWIVPFFGAILNGVSGAAVMILCAAILGYVAYGVYRLDIRAWWSALLLIVTACTSICVTFSRLGMTDFYEKMNMPAEQLEFMSDIKFMDGPAMVLCTAVCAAAILGYLFYIRRYFVQPTDRSN